MNFRDFFCCCFSGCCPTPADKTPVTQNPGQNLAAKLIPVTPQSSGQSTPVSIPSRFTPQSPSPQKRLGL